MMWKDVEVPQEMLNHWACAEAALPSRPLRVLFRRRRQQLVGDRVRAPELVYARYERRAISAEGETC
jgi:hypothetical protein